MSKRSLAVMVIIETDDTRLFPERLDVSTAGKTARLRQAVIDNLPHVSRVVMVLDEEHAKLMVHAHNVVMAEVGAADLISRPPPDYVPPTRE